MYLLERNFEKHYSGHFSYAIQLEIGFIPPPHILILNILLISLRAIMNSIIYILTLIITLSLP